MLPDRSITGGSCSELGSSSEFWKSDSNTGKCGHVRRLCPSALQIEQGIVVTFNLDRLLNKYSFNRLKKKERTSILFITYMNVKKGTKP